MSIEDVNKMFDNPVEDNANGTGDGGGESSNHDPSGASSPSDDGAHAPAQNQDNTVAELQAELRAMREEMAYLKGRTEQSATKEDPAPDQPITLRPDQVFTPEEMAKFQEDGDLSILTAGMARVSQAAWTQALAKLPEMINNAVQTAVSATNTTTKLFDQHKELNTPTRRLVLKAHAEEISRANPKWDANAVMAAAIDQTYKDFNLTKPGAAGSPGQEQRPRSGNPTGAGGRSGGGARQQSSSQPTSAQERTKKQIDAMFD